MLLRVFGDEADTRYFDEHTHIDQHHGRMAIERLIGPAIAKWGGAIIPEIVTGFEEFRLLQELADNDLIQQIAWTDRCDDHRIEAADARLFDESGRPRADRMTFVEPDGEVSISHVHDVDELLVVREGVLDLITGHEQSVRLRPGEGMLISRRRLHGSVVRSTSCRYDVYHVDGTAPC